MLENQIKKLSWYVFITMILVGLIFIFSYFLQVVNEDEQPVAGVQRGSEYQSYTSIATTSSEYLFKSGQGTFGSIVISKLGAGIATFYDASTTLPLQRTIQATSSLRVLGVIEASQAAGTYTYDTIFVDGLMGVFTGTQGTSTLTWR